MVAESTRQLFADRNFRLYTIASVVSWLSFFAQTLAVSWLTWELTHSADRHDRHRILFIAYVAALIQSLLLALTAMAGVLHVGSLGPLAQWYGLDAPIYGVTVMAFIALLVFMAKRDQAA